MSPRRAPRRQKGLVEVSYLCGEIIGTGGQQRAAGVPFDGVHFVLYSQRRRRERWLDYVRRHREREEEEEEAAERLAE
jgi:hypothetical protein